MPILPTGSKQKECNHGEISEKKKCNNLGLLYASPMSLWVNIFFVIPLLIIILFSFLKPGLYGGVIWEFSLQAYKELTNPNLVNIAFHTTIISIVATVITTVIAVPCGYCVARSRHQTFLLLLIIIPFWTNFLIRVFAWLNILGNDGFFNSLLIRLGIIDEPIRFLYNQGAVILVLVYMYLPYAILPLFSSIDKFDFSLLEAARDLGASKTTAVFRILLPNIKGGIYTSVMFTFIPSFGSYAVPLLVGGNESYMLGNVIADQLLKRRNWPAASAISMVLTLATVVGVIIMLTVQKKEAEKNDKNRKIK
ncbi:MAG: ABC transporter permease [Termitinemataceae bacterium]|nr:MAG: ABC transporter permease [Termitinemataceae bacterium]